MTSKDNFNLAYIIGWSSSFTNKLQCCLAKSEMKVVKSPELQKSSSLLASL